MRDVEHRAQALAQAQAAQVGDAVLGDDQPGFAARDGHRAAEAGDDAAGAAGRGGQGDAGIGDMGSAFRCQQLGATDHLSAALGFTRP